MLENNINLQYLSLKNVISQEEDIIAHRLY
jgi:hypothetical protein